MNCHDLGRWYEGVVSDFCKQSGNTQWLKFKTKHTQSLFGDFSLYDGFHCVDAKVERVATANFPIEITQCADRDEPGWFQQLQACDQIWYSAFDFAWGNGWMSYRISLERLRKSYSKLQKHRVETSKNWGRTIIDLVSLGELCDLKIATNYEELQEFMRLNCAPPVCG